MKVNCKKGLPFSPSLTKLSLAGNNLLILLMGKSLTLFTVYVYYLLIYWSLFR
jgi:hypothetical protein